MSKLSQLPPRPHRRAARPAYPRTLGLGVIAVVAACGGSVDVEGAGSEETVTSTGHGWGGGMDGGAAAPWGGGGYGAEGGQGGSAGQGWGGGLDGGMPNPWGGGGSGAEGGQGGADGPGGSGGAGAGGS